MFQEFEKGGIPVLSIDGAHPQQEPTNSCPEVLANIAKEVLPKWCSHMDLTLDERRNAEVWCSKSVTAYIYQACNLNK